MSDKDFPSSEFVAMPVSGVILCSLAAVIIAAIIFLFLFWLPLAWPFIAVALIAGPLIGLMMRRGKCPHCGRVVMLTPGPHKCPSCKHRLVIRQARIVDLT